MNLLLFEKGGDDVSVGGGDVNVETPLATERFSAMLKIYNASINRTQYYFLLDSNQAFEHTFYSGFFRGINLISVSGKKISDSDPADPKSH